MKSIIAKCLTAALFLATVAATLSAQTNKPGFPEQVSERFFKEVLQLPQEKLYLHMDKPYYSAGEDIWFKGYLVNAITHTPTAKSNFIYVELINKSDSIFQRVKIRKDSLGFDGKLTLSPEIPSGDYTVRAYSYFMRNAGDDFFFRKNIYIGNPIDDAVNGTISYGKPKDGVVTATIRLTDANKRPIAAKRVNSLLDWTGDKKKMASGTTNSEGSVSFPIRMDSSAYKNKSMEVSFEDPQSKYKQKFMVPSFAEDFDVQFFPEGGTFLADCFQTIAFKAIGSNGLSVEVTGSVVDEQGKEYFQFQSKNKGMGKVVLQAQAGQVYYAKVKTAAGLEKKFKIGQANASGVLLQLKHNLGKIFYEITNKTSIQDQTLCLIIHSRGKLLLVKTLDATSKFGNLSENILPAGIVTFSILNQLTGETLSERLSFILPSKTYTISMGTDKPLYNRREKVMLNFSLLDKNAAPVKGNFSLSITDSHSVIQNPLADNIMSNLLLTSDLKGYLEDPGSYFVDASKATQENLDLLMLTQGWRRFNMSAVVNGKTEKPKIYLEIGQTLSGQVTNVFNKPAKDLDILALTLGNAFDVKKVKTDSLGRYFIDASFQDSTGFLLKATNKKKTIADVRIIPDPDDFPVTATFIPIADKAPVAEQTEYFSQSKEKYFNDGGLRVVSLKEVSVDAQKRSASLASEINAPLADKNIGVDELDKMQTRPILEILMEIPGLMIKYDSTTSTPIVTFNRRGVASIFIDNYENLNNNLPDFGKGRIENGIENLTSDDIESILVFKGVNAAMFGAEIEGGAIAITLRKGASRKTIQKANIAKVTPLGYQKPYEFYVPKYDVDSVYRDSKPDLRTTIFWKPSLSTDNMGNFSTEFPTADKDYDYDVTLEGISEKGEIYRYTGTIRRKNSSLIK
ncbi:MAG: TonB-dependent receptor plug domain-containing protein [Bacteroidales bacterium]|nr:TonB-dependent receptor plug domain-containing protein [Bacteroidales bacterium]